MNCDIGKQGHEKYVIRTNKMHTSYINNLISFSLLIFYYYHYWYFMNRKDTDTDNVAIKQPGKDDKGKNEEWESTECINHKAVLQQYGHM